MIIFIDGPTAAGKTTLTKLLQKETQWPTLLVGGIYRAIAKECIDLPDIPDEEHAKKVCQDFDINKTSIIQNKSNSIGLKAAILPRNPTVFREVNNSFQHIIQPALDNIENILVDGSNRFTQDNPNAVYIFLDAQKKDRISRQQSSTASTYEEAKKLIIEKDAIDKKEVPARIIPLDYSIIIPSIQNHPEFSVKNVLEEIENRASLLNKQCVFSKNGLSLAPK